MRIRWLGWAGVEITADDATVVIDPLLDARAVYAWAGDTAADVPLPETAAPAPKAAVAGLLTHLHRDHADAGALTQALQPGAQVLQPAPGGGDDLEEVGLAHANWELEETRLPRTHAQPWETFEIPPFAITALPAADGAGDPQVSWLVEHRGKRVLHCGDTLFHGDWWRIAIRHGPPDVVLLPISGATNDFPNRQPPSPFSAVMRPEQAAVAAELLQARTAVPIHYGGFDFPPHYVPVPNCERVFREEAEGRGYDVAVLVPGEALEV